MSYNFDLNSQAILHITQKNAEFQKINGQAPKAYCETYGCQQNVADMEKIKGILTYMGYEMCGNAENADIAVINTCAVREHAELRALGNIGALSHLKKKKQDMLIVVCGCMAAQPHIAEKLKKSFPYVDIVFPPSDVEKLPDFIYRRITDKKRVFQPQEVQTPAVAEGVPLLRDGKTKAWLSIMYGCNNFCTYCIVPYVRGRERSRNAADIEKEFRGLIESGVKDITLLGQNVNSYGRGNDDGIDFPMLLERLAKIDGDFVLRFMTSHPKDASDRLIEVIANNEKIERHIHLPFQSGSDTLLKRMNRHYNRKQYLEIINRAKAAIPNVSFTSDVIVGFPGETEQDFLDTLSLVEEVKFSSLFTFIYSKRKGTPAAEYPDDTTDAEKHSRFERLNALQDGISEQLNRELIGKNMRVIVENLGRGEEYPLSGRTLDGRLIHLKGDKKYIGEFVNAEIKDCSPWALFGEIKI